MSVYFLGTSFDAVDSLNTVVPNRNRKNINEIKKASQQYSLITKKYNPKSVNIKILVKGIGSNTKEMTSENNLQFSFLNKIKQVTWSHWFFYFR